MKTAKTPNSWEAFPVNLTVFVVLAALSFFAGGWLKISPYITFGLLLFTGVIKAISVRPALNWPDRKLAIPFVFTVAAALLVSSSLFGQFFFDGSNLAISNVSAHDAWWHIALIESAKKSIPPINPVYFPRILTGYHYLTDVLLANVSLLTRISPVDLYLKWGPLFLSWLYVATSLALLRKVVSGRIAYAGVLLLLFGGGLAFFVPVLFPATSFNQSFFWLDQAGRYVVNQQLLFSLTVVNAVIYLLLEDKSKNWLPLGLLLGSLVGIKVYAAVVIWPIVFIWLAREWFREKDFRYLLAGLLGAVITLALLLISGQGTGFPFIFVPGWLVQSMMTGSDRFNFSTWEIHRQLFTQTHNYLRLVSLWVGAMAVFLTGNFGFKLLALLFVPFLWPARMSVNRIVLFSLVGFIVLSLIIPLLFLQKGVVWNVVQFMHFAQMPLVLLLVLAASLKKVAAAAKILLVVSLAAGVFTSGRVIVDDLRRENYTFYPAQTLSALRNIPDKGLIIVGSNLSNSSLVSAVSARPVYYADPAILSILLIDAAPRREYLQALEAGDSPCPPGSYFIAGEEKGNISVYQCAENARLLK